MASSDEREASRMAEQKAKFQRFVAPFCLALQKLDSKCEFDFALGEIKLGATKYDPAARCYLVVSAQSSSLSLVVSDHSKAGRQLLTLESRYNFYPRNQYVRHHMKGSLLISEHQDIKHFARGVLQELADEIARSS
tara:strand:+ start:11489 stop:11896 length:408 start_codon:yes stop_codon:yes gene_type:complete